VYINIVSVDGQVNYARRDFRTGRGSGRRHGGRERKKTLKYQRGPIESTRSDPESETIPTQVIVAGDTRRRLLSMFSKFT